MFQGALELACSTVAISSKATAEQWEKVKMCLEKAASSAKLVEEAELKKASYCLDLQIVRALLETYQDSLDPQVLQKLWSVCTEMSNASTIFCVKSKVFDPSSSETNMVLAKNKQQFISMTNKWGDPKLVKGSLQKLTLDFLPHSNDVATECFYKKRKERVVYTHLQDEAVLVGALKFDSDWELAKEEGCQSLQGRNKTGLEVSDE
jgi:hypothetical protein